MTEKLLQHWMDSVTGQHLLVGYGSLMNQESRQRFSNLHHPSIGVTVSGFHRAWLTRSWHEQQTYVGAVPDYAATLNGQLIPAPLDPALAKREQDYRFTELDASLLDFDLAPQPRQQLLNWLEQTGKSLWICETLECLPADEHYPVSQTYIDTCLAGCFEHGGQAQAQAFIDTTRLWAHPRRQDRQLPRYPRAATVAPDMQARIDTLLESACKLC